MARQLHLADAMEPRATEPSTEHLRSVVNDALKNASELFRAELALAKDELINNAIASLKRAVMAGVLGVVLLICAVMLLAATLVLALGGTTLAALGVCVGFGGAGAIALLVSKKQITKPHLERTRTRIERDVHVLMETTRADGDNA